MKRQRRCPDHKLSHGRDTPRVIHGERCQPSDTRVRDQRKAQREAEIFGDVIRETRLRHSESSNDPKVRSDITENFCVELDHANWIGRVPLYEAYPLLGYVCLFGASYGERLARSVAKTLGGRGLTA